VRAIPATSATLVALAIVLTARRMPPQRPVRWALGGCVVPSLVFSSIVLGRCPSFGTWPWPAQVVFGGGAALAFLALLNLGTSFGLLPAARALVITGPHGIVRHPAYSGELAMVLACAAATCARATAPTEAAIAVAAGLGTVAGAVRRITVEERTLTILDGWADYVAVTRYRLIPGIW
jgi:protein-S-isoprenylcysteine O-methyltransferase Ste14